MTNQSLGITEKHLKRQLPLTGVYRRLYLHVYLILITPLPIICDFSISLKGTGLSTKLSTIVVAKNRTQRFIHATPTSATKHHYNFSLT